MMVLALVALCGPSPSTELQDRLDVVQAVERACHAHEAGDAVVLEGIANARDPDPWAVADVLARSGSKETAEALARSSRPIVREPLLAYLKTAQPSESIFPAKGNRTAILDAIAGIEEIQSPVLRHRLAFEAGDLLQGEGNFEASLSSFRRASKEARDLGWLAGEARSESRAGSIARRLPMGLPQALESWSRASELSAAIGDLPAQALLTFYIGNACGELGRLERSRDAFLQARDLFRELEDGLWERRVLRSLAVLHRRTGRPGDALTVLEEAARLASGTPAEDEGALLLERAEVHGQLGDFDRALELSERALEFFEKRADALLVPRLLRKGVGDSLHSLGLCELRRGAHLEAYEYFDEALAVFEELGNQKKITSAQANLALAEMHLGRLDEAEARQRDALAIAEELGDRWKRAFCHFHLGRILRRAGRFEEAAASDAELLAIGEDLASARLLMRGYLNASKRLLAEDRPAEALAASREAMEHTRRVVSGLEPGQDAVARDHRAEVFEVAVRAARATGDPEALLWSLEAGRAQSLLESLGGAARVEESLVPAALARDVRLADEEERAALQRVRDNEADDDDAARASLASARERQERARRSVRASAPGGEVLFPEPASLDELRGTLAAGEAFVLYTLADEDALALVVTREGARSVPLGASDEIARRCRGFRSVLDRARGIGLVKAPEDAPADDGASLRALLIEALGLEPGTTRLLVSPDGPLAYVPFALVAPGHEVVLVPSATTYRLLGARRAAPGSDVLALGVSAYGERGLPGLPGAAREAEAVGDEVLLDAEATEPGLGAALAREEPWRAVHLACHALVDPDDPLENELSLTPSDATDGRLTVLDVFNLDLRTDLAVLSACETGVGTLYRTEGVLGFTRAFLDAGASSVVVSLWRVGDEATQALMTRLYELWNPAEGEGLPLATALRLAQEHVRSQPGWSGPEYWAAWQLWGRPGE